jgi:hypothetical protein
MTLTSYFSSARFIIGPSRSRRPSSVMPGCRPSLPRLRSSFGNLRFAIVMLLGGKYAQL